MVKLNGLRVGTQINAYIGLEMLSLGSKAKGRITTQIIQDTKVARDLMARCCDR